MASAHTKTFRLPGGVTVTAIPLTTTASAGLLRRAAYDADIYLLFGQTFAGPRTAGHSRSCTGPGFYVGISQALRRAAVSLRQWSTVSGRLAPELVILVRFDRPPGFDLLRLVETHLIRQLWLQFTLLNTVSGCPTAARRLSRREVDYGLWLTFTLIRRIRGRWLPGVTGTPTGGTLHEQIVRYVRTRGPVLTTEIVAAAPAAGIRLTHHGDPTAVVRRDGATRERDSRGPTRIRHTRVLARGRWTCLFYPPTMSRAQAIATWRQGTTRATRASRPSAPRRTPRPRLRPAVRRR